MNRYLYRVQYTDTDGAVATEPVCVRALTAAAAQTEVEAATDRYRLASDTTRTVTLVLTTADV